MRQVSTPEAVPLDTKKPQIISVLLQKDGDLQLSGQCSLLCESILNRVVLVWMHMCFSSVFPASLVSPNFGQKRDINHVYLSYFFFLTVKFCGFLFSSQCNLKMMSTHHQHHPTRSAISQKRNWKSTRKQLSASSKGWKVSSVYMLGFTF